MTIASEPDRGDDHGNTNQVQKVPASRADNDLRRHLAREAERDPKSEPRDALRDLGIRSREADHWLDLKDLEGRDHYDGHGAECRVRFPLANSHSYRSEQRDRHRP